MDSLPEEHSVYRLVHSSKRARDNNMEPKPDAFKPSLKDEGKLSVDYEKLTTPEESLARFGATYKYGKEEFKEHKEFNIYLLNIGFLKSISSIIDVYPDPVIVNPKEKGKPDNPAHTLIHFNDIPLEDEPEVLRKIQKKALEQTVIVDRNKTDELVEEYRKQWD